MRKTRPLLSEDALVERWRRRGMEGKQTQVVLGPSYPDGAGTDETQQSRKNKLFLSTGAPLLCLRVCSLCSAPRRCRAALRP